MDASSPAKTGPYAESAKAAFDARANTRHAPLFAGAWEVKFAKMLGFPAWEIAGGEPGMNTDAYP